MKHDTPREQQGPLMKYKEEQIVSDPCRLVFLSFDLRFTIKTK